MMETEDLENQSSLSNILTHSNKSIKQNITKVPGARQRLSSGGSIDLLNKSTISVSSHTSNVSVCRSENERILLKLIQQINHHKSGPKEKCDALNTIQHTIVEQLTTNMVNPVDIRSNTSKSLSRFILDQLCPTLLNEMTSPVATPVVCGVICNTLSYFAMYFGEDFDACARKLAHPLLILSGTTTSTISQYTFEAVVSLFQHVSTLGPDVITGDLIKHQSPKVRQNCSKIIKSLISQQQQQQSSSTTIAGESANNVDDLLKRNVNQLQSHRAHISFAVSSFIVDPEAETRMIARYCLNSLYSIWPADGERIIESLDVAQAKEFYYLFPQFNNNKYVEVKTTIPQPYTKEEELEMKMKIAKYKMEKMKKAQDERIQKILRGYKRIVGANGNPSDVSGVDYQHLTTKDREILEKYLLLQWKGELTLSSRIKAEIDKSLNESTESSSSSLVDESMESNAIKLDTSSNDDLSMENDSLNLSDSTLDQSHNVGDVMSISTDNLPTVSSPYGTQLLHSKMKWYQLRKAQEQASKSKLNTAISPLLVENNDTIVVTSEKPVAETASAIVADVTFVYKRESFILSFVSRLLFSIVSFALTTSLIVMAHHGFDYLQQCPREITILPPLNDNSTLLYDLQTNYDDLFVMPTDIIVSPMEDEDEMIKSQTFEQDEEIQQQEEVQENEQQQSVDAQDFSEVFEEIAFPVLEDDLISEAFRRLVMVDDHIDNHGMEDDMQIIVEDEIMTAHDEEEVAQNIIEDEISTQQSEQLEQQTVEVAQIESNEETAMENTDVMTAESEIEQVSNVNEVDKQNTIQSETTKAVIITKSWELYAMILIPLIILMKLLSALPKFR